VAPEESGTEARVSGERADAAVPSVAPITLPAIESEPRVQAPGLTSDLRLAPAVASLGDRVSATVTFAADQGVACVVPTGIGKWRRPLTLSVRFAAPPSPTVEAGRWYRLGFPGGLEFADARSQTSMLQPGRSLEHPFPLHHVVVLRPGKEDENESIWSGRLTEFVGRIDLKAEALDAADAVTATYGIATLETQPGSEVDVLALAWLREHRMLEVLGPYNFAHGAGGWVADGMRSFLEAFPTSRFADEARYSLAVALHTAKQSDAARELLQSVAGSAREPELRAAAAVEDAQICRDRRDKAGVLEALDRQPDPATFPLLADTVKRHRVWAGKP
jgi:hypothetical protein